MPAMPELPVLCHLCAEPIAEPAEGSVGGSTRGWWTFTWDHVIPRSKGGSHGLENLRPAHLVCNIRRKDMPMEQWVASRRWEAPIESRREAQALPRPCLVCDEPIEQPKAMQLLHLGECAKERARQLDRESYARRQAAQQRFGRRK